MNIIKIPSIDGLYHSIDASLLTPGGWVLDAGCRGFCFAKAMAARGCRVLALDPGADVVDPKLPRVRYIRKALTAHSGRYLYVQTPGQIGNYVIDRRLKTKMLGADLKAFETAPIDCITIHTLMRELGIHSFDAVKLDIEGAEYDIVEHWPGPISKQLSIEFHDFYQDVLPEGSTYYDRVIPHLSQWYHCVGMNEYDSLFVASDLHHFYPRQR